MVAGALLGCAEGRTTFSRDGGATDVPAPSDAAPIEAGACVPGQLYCEGNTQYQCTADGLIVNRVRCEGATPICAPLLGCRACVPNATRCDPAAPNTPQRCLGNGMSWSSGAPCVGAGASCVSGFCADRCSESATGRSYLGCDYWPTMTANSQLDPNFTFGVALSNPQTYEVRVTITGGALTAPRELTLAPGAIETVTLPWVQELVAFTPTYPGCRGEGDPACRLPRAPARSTLRRGGAYHVRSDGPIAAYQFNPLNFSREGGLYSFTNDASLLLPQGVMRQRYVVSTWPNFVIRATLATTTYGGFVTIVGVAGEGTTVTVRPTASVGAGPGVPIILAGTTATFTLQQGDALQLVSADSRVDAQGRGQDLSGTIIESSLPVAVYVGHDCTNIPEDRVACDHLEEQLLPAETWGRDSFVSALRDRGAMTPSVVRVISQANDNRLTFDPPDVQPPVTLAAGQVLQFASNRHVRVTGSGAFLASQFMIGQGPRVAGMPGAGDPAMVFEVPVQQYRAQYAFYVPTTYPQSFLNIVAPAGTPLLLDEQPLMGTPEVVSGHDVYTLPIAAGAHRLRSPTSVAFGIKVYGIAEYTSYMYPGGLDLQLITPG